MTYKLIYVRYEIIKHKNNMVVFDADTQFKNWHITNTVAQTRMLVFIAAHCLFCSGIYCPQFSVHHFSGS